MNKEVSDLNSTYPKVVMCMPNWLCQGRTPASARTGTVEKADTIGLHKINKSSRLVIIDGLREGDV
jgi:hypothetical protein